ncbi:MAG: hypothetical protein ABL982_23215 [Vicinamibacterales bacterium]
MGLYQQVQFLEQRVLMLEEFLLELTLHLNPQGSGSFPQLNTGFFGPRVQPTYGTTPISYSRRHEVHPTFANNEVSNELPSDPDLASLDHSLVGSVETSVSEFGTTDCGDDDFGDTGDVAADAGDSDGDAGDGGVGGDL